MRLSNVIGKKAGRHRLHTLALPGQQQTGAIGFQGKRSIQVPRGLRQAIKIGREAFLLAAWRDSVRAHELHRITKKVVATLDLYSKVLFYNIVVRVKLIVLDSRAAGT